MTRREALAALALLGGALPARAHARPASAGRTATTATEILRPCGGVPAHVAGVVREAYGFQQTPDGDYLVFDRRNHTVWRIAADFESARAIVTIGQEPGRLYGPTAFAVGPNGFFVVADAPDGRERVQLFDDRGIRLAGFTFPGRAAARVTLDTFVLNGVSSLQFTGRSVLVCRPEDGALISEYRLTGTPLRAVGALRRTGQEADRDLHLALNTGLPLVAPDGSLWFVFFAGEPRFRKYDTTGTLLFERLMQGREVDGLLARQPTTWPRRRIGDDELPVVPPLVRTAAVSPGGDLWVAFVSGDLYVFDPDGEKVRVLRLHATGPLLPNSLAFASPSRLLVTPGLFEFRIS